MKSCYASNDALQEHDFKLRKALESEGHEIKTPYVLHWIPDQLEDLYTILNGGSYLIIVELGSYENSKPPMVKRNESTRA